MCGMYTVESTSTPQPPLNEQQLIQIYIFRLSETQHQHGHVVGLVSPYVLQHAVINIYQRILHFRDDSDGTNFINIFSDNRLTEW